MRPKPMLLFGQKANSKSAAVSVLQGDIAVAKKDAGKACQLYEQAIYFDPNYKEAYLKFADVYKGLVRNLLSRSWNN